MTDNTANNIYQDDPYAIDPNVVKSQNERAAGKGSKVQWHELPKGEATSVWRILPFTKRRTFFTKVTKHWGVPGMEGSITCPRSFDDPDNPKWKLKCAICEKFFELLKSKEPGDVALAKETLRSSTSYYVNALKIGPDGQPDYEAGVGVLNIPYGVWQTLYDWTQMANNPKFVLFSHPIKGRNIIITSTVVPGAAIPGKPGSQKRTYTVTPDDASPLEDMTVMEKIYDLDTVVGIPTWEFTQNCLNRILTGDESLRLPEGVPAWRGQLMAGNEAPNAVPASVLSASANTTVHTGPMAPPATIPTEAPKFASAAVESAIQQPKVVVGTPIDVNVPTTTLDATGKPVCFAVAFNEDNKTCLKCPVNDDCEMAILKAKRAKRVADGLAEAAAQAAPPTPTPVAVTEAPAPAASKSDDDIRAMMLKVLNKK